jgi:hypothetical protein
MECSEVPAGEKQYRQDPSVIEQGLQVGRRSSDAELPITRAGLIQEEIRG